MEYKQELNLEKNVKLGEILSSSSSSSSYHHCKSKLGSTK